MTAKIPVYWRTKDGRKVVIVRQYGESTNVVDVYNINHGSIEFAKVGDLTEWKEPVTREVWVRIYEDGSVFSGYTKAKNHSNLSKFIAQKKIPITEGEFDD